MEFDEFIEKLREPEGREEIAKEFHGKASGVLDYDMTLDCVNYLSLPILLTFDEQSQRKGTPIYRHGEIRNECWNCGNYPREINPEGEKGYYKCEFCGKTMHL